VKRRRRRRLGLIPDDERIQGPEGLREPPPRSANAAFELTTYSGIKHGFTIQGAGYSGPSTEDALAKTTEALRLYLSG